MKTWETEKFMLKCSLGFLKNSFMIQKCKKKVLLVCIFLKTILVVFIE